MSLATSLDSPFMIRKPPCSPPSSHLFPLPNSIHTLSTHPSTLYTIPKRTPRNRTSPPLITHSLCIWYTLLASSPHWTLAAAAPEDIRVETSGQWTRGMCVVDRRNRKKRLDDDGEGGQVPSDTGNWLGVRSGNRIDRVVGTPGEERFGGELLGRVFG